MAPQPPSVRVGDPKPDPAPPRDGAPTEGAVSWRLGLGELLETTVLG